MDIRKLQRAIVDGLEDVKAQDIVVFNTEALSPLFERVIIASGTSNRQTKALASSVRDSVKSRGMEVMRTEGEDNGEWIIVDCGAAVAHIMQPAIREYYRLEEIWGGKAVKMKLGGGAPAGLPKASEPDDEPAPAKAAPRKTAGKASGKSVSKTGGKAAAGKTGKSTSNAPSKAPARKTAASKSAATAGASSAKPAAKRAGARRPSAAAPRATQTVVVGGKPAAKKAPARKAAAPAARKSR
jgi:ribosome-associated protein